MKDTAIVFTGMGILLLLPIFFYGIRSIIRGKNEKGFRKRYLNSVILGVLGIVFILLLFKVYNFTLKHQAPLVAEGYIRSSRGRDQLKGMGIDSDKSLIGLSENIYENEDGSTSMYLKFETEDEEIFTKIYMEKSEDTWQVTVLERIEDNADKDPEIKKRFFPIKEGTT